MHQIGFTRGILTHQCFSNVTVLLNFTHAAPHSSADSAAPVWAAVRSAWMHTARRKVATSATQRVKWAPMKLLIIRHAKAEERPTTGLFKKKDASRRLTDEGRKIMRKIAKALREIAPAIDMLVSSPLVRARETADIVADVFGLKNVSEQPLLAPDGDKQALINWLKEQPAEHTVAIVGHEPHLSSFASLLIGGKDEALLVLKKGASCLIEFNDIPAPGAGKLSWLLQPAQLKKIDA